MLAILAQAECQAAIDRELQARRLVPAKLEKEGLIADEVKLAESFGYSPREVKRYLRRARNVISAGVTVDIPTAADLAEHFEAIHGSAVDEIESDDGGWIKRRRRDRKARREAQDALFAVGTLVADIAARALFDLSYALAVMTLSEV
ncbi:MAG TPA: hypothetical protein VMS11_01405 [Solirubrobacterales bacterium]|nr:hypothetical protein [Solirubrobacterales bacterium]